MANNYETLGAVGTVELLGGGKTQEVVQGTFRSKQTGVLFTLVIARVDWTPSHLALIVPVVTDAIDKSYEVPGVQDLNVYQDVNNTGQFVNRVDATVSSTSGNSTVTIHPAYGTMFDDRFAAAVNAEVANLDAIENAE